MTVALFTRWRQSTDHEGVTNCAGRARGRACGARTGAHRPRRSSGPSPFRSARKRSKWSPISSAVGMSMVVDNGAPSPPSLKERSEEHTSELQSRGHLVCRLLLEKKKSHGTTCGPTQRVQAVTTTTE